jgi:hypothetical protein
VQAIGFIKRKLGTVLQQGDWIGRILLTTVSFFRYKSGPNFLFHGKSCVLILAKDSLGYVLGDFFTQLIWSPCFGSAALFVGRKDVSRHPRPHNGHLMDLFCHTNLKAREK